MSLEKLFCLNLHSCLNKLFILLILLNYKLSQFLLVFLTDPSLNPQIELT